MLKSQSAQCSQGLLVNHHSPESTLRPLAQKLDMLSMINYMVAPSAAIATAIATVQAKPLVAAPLEAAVAKSAYSVPD